MAVADYKVYIDWDNDGGLYLSTFETGLDGWVASGDLLPTLTNSSTFVWSGTQCMQIRWVPFTPFQFDVAGRGFDQGLFGISQLSNPTSAFQFDKAGNGFDQGTFGVNNLGDTDIVAPRVKKTITGLTPGQTYTITYHVRSTDNQSRVRLNVEGVVNGDYSVSQYEWQEMTVVFTATAASHVLAFEQLTNAIATGFTYVDAMRITTELEDITDYVLSRSDLSFKAGRDLGRSLSDVAAGDMSFELLNTDYRFTPENTGSPLYGKVMPGKQILVVARKPFETLQVSDPQEFNLFQGFVDDLVLQPGAASRSVSMTAVDLLGKLKDNLLSTPLYQGLRSGDAIHKVLDDVGWPTSRRDIDPGASIFQWWWEEGTDGMTAIQKIVNSEGIPSIFYIDPTGVFVFRDRHHRVMEARSTTVQHSFASGVAGDPEPCFSDPYTYDIGWRDLINSIQVTVEQRMPGAIPEQAFNTEDSFSLANGQSIVIPAMGSDPFINAITPKAGTDFTVLTGAVNVSISRTSGQSTDITVRAVGGPATIQGMALRAILVSVSSSYKFTAEDTESIAAHGSKTLETEMPWTCLTDLVGISEVILGSRANRRPIITFAVNNDNDVRLEALLNTRLSDRVHITEPETFVNTDLFIESVEHSISSAGLHHVASFAGEKVLAQPTNVFTFDDPARGFNDGVFGYRGIDTASTVFVLDVSKLDEKLLGF